MLIEFSGLFSDCKSLKYLPNISKWLLKDNPQVDKPIYIGNNFKCNISYEFNSNNSGKSLAYLFYNCSSLISLPDISNWKTKTILIMEGMLWGCSSLISLPDISKWNIENITHINHLFSECSSLKYLSDISNWVMTNVLDLSFLFYLCSSLITLPDISKWDASNAKNFRYMFSGCSNLKVLPNIIKWKTNKVTDMSFTFYSCPSIVRFPDISKWINENHKIKIDKIIDNNTSSYENTDWNMSNEEKSISIITNSIKNNSLKSEKKKLKSEKSEDSKEQKIISSGNNESHIDNIYEKYKYFNDFDNNSNVVQEYYDNFYNK